MLYTLTVGVVHCFHEAWDSGNVEVGVVHCGGRRWTLH